MLLNEYAYKKIYYKIKIIRSLCALLLFCAYLICVYVYLLLKIISLALIVI